MLVFKIRAIKCLTVDAKRSRVRERKEKREGCEVTHVQNPESKQQT
jgi:hypothetical protein